MSKPAWVAWSLAAFLVAAAFGCGGKGGDTAESGGGAPAGSVGDEIDFAEVGARLAGAVAGNLKSELTRALTQGSHAEALEVCHMKAIPLTEEIADAAEVRADIKRTSLRYRNPANAPDEYEKEALEYFRVAAAEGSLPPHYTQRIEREGKEYYRFYKPLQVSGLCLSCHGAEDRLADGVAERLKEAYPDDRATGYEPGDFRGVIRVEMSRS